jgi:hypothetical protein
MSQTIEHCIMSWEMLRGWIGGSIKDMSEEELLFRPAENRSHAWWIYGHIVLSTDIARYLADAPALCPKEWEKLFGLGSPASDTADSYPSKEDLIAQFNKNVYAVIASIKQLTDDQINDGPASEQPEPVREYFSTKGKIITGYAYHCMNHHGQIMTIRNMLGKS